MTGSVIRPAFDNIASHISNLETVKTIVDDLESENLPIDAVIETLQKKIEDAEVTLKRALEASNYNRKLHYAYGKLLLEKGTASNETLEYHFRRSYSPGDPNYNAQLLHARQLFINKEDLQSKALFKKLGASRLPSEFRNKAQYPLTSEFAGSIAKVEATYSFILRDGVGDWIYVNPDNFEVDDWTLLTVGTRMRFKIAFSMKGACAINVKYEIVKDGKQKES